MHDVSVVFLQLGGFLSRKISDQVVVITGASSGIGLTTAMLAAERGARVIISSPNKNDLRDAVSQIRQKADDALYVVADVSSLDEVDEIARRATAEYGRIDTWINNEG